MKKTLSILLVLIMLLSLIPVSAFAAGNNYEEFLDVAGKAIEKIADENLNADVDADIDADIDVDADVDDLDADASDGFLVRLLGKIGTLLTKLPALIEFFKGLDQRF